MGLDAVVYTNRKHLNLGQDEQFAQCDPEREKSILKTMSRLENTGLS